MTVKAFAKKFDISEDEMWDALKEAGFLKNDYSPKTKFVNDGLFDEEGNVVDSKALYSEMEEYFGNNDEDEDEDDENEDYEDDDSDEEVEVEEDEDDNDEVDVDSTKEILENLSATKEEIAELIGILTDKLVNYVDEEESDDEVEEDEEEEETPKSKKSSKKSKDEDDDEDPNAPGKYRGWTITVKGISVAATKGKKKLTTSLRGNIRAKIDEVED